MLLGSFNRLKGIMQRIGYWYSLFCSLAVTIVLFLFPCYKPMVRPMLIGLGLFSLLITFLWGYAFREKPAGH